MTRNEFPTSVKRDFLGPYIFWVQNTMVLVECARSVFNFLAKDIMYYKTERILATLRRHGPYRVWYVTSYTVSPSATVCLNWSFVNPEAIHENVLLTELDISFLCKQRDV